MKTNELKLIYRALKESDQALKVFSNGSTLASVSDALKVIKKEIKKGAK